MDIQDAIATAEEINSSQRKRAHHQAQKGQNVHDMYGDEQEESPDRQDDEEMDDEINREIAEIVAEDQHHDGQELDYDENDDQD